MSQDGDHRDQSDGEGKPPAADAPEDAGVAALPDPATTTRWQTIRDWIRQTAGASDERKPPDPEEKESTQAP